MSYENAPATKLLATNCCCCGRPLVDSVSVELGIGPECRSGMNEGISEIQRTTCNRLTHAAAVAAQSGKIEIVRQCAKAIRELDMPVLADKVLKRFVNAERLAKIIITIENDCLNVKTPYKRSMGEDFVAAWKAIPGRRYNFQHSVNVLPNNNQSRELLWQLLKNFFPGEFGKAPTGVFRVPTKAEVKAA
jgi:hypothetical protein